MKKLFSLIGALVMSAVVYAQGTFSINEVKMTPGETKEVPLIMTATENIKGFQLDIYLPDGLSFVLNSKNKPVASLTDWGALHMLTSKIQSDGALRCVVVSMSGDIFEAGDAPVINFEVAAAEDVPLGDCSILIKNVVLTPESGSKLKIEEIVNAAKIYKNLEVKVSAEANGTASGAGTFESGTEITLTATPDEGYHFVKWSDGSTQNPYTFVLNEAKELTASFEANKYEVVYTLEGEAFKKDSVLYGAAITAPEAPAKEGHTFAGWGEVPETMPANDLALNGTYTVNKYNVIYTVDGTEYKKSEVEYGAAITAEAAPEKEGHTFSGWSEIPETMPAQDLTVTGTFTVNKYEVVYTLEGEAFKKDSVLYGAAITTPEAPAKEGHTFAGWGEVPETMPANDLALNGTYTVNKYSIIYTVDGTEYKKSEVEYGAAITAEAAPEKEGHTFSGWSEIPETMPAQDVTVTGTFTVNKYEVVYTLEGEAFKKDSVLYGAAITAPEAPAKEGHTFAGWGEVPETMPANDLALNGTYTVNKYNIIYTVDGTEYKKSEVEYGAAITAEAAPEKEGHTFSGWSEIPETMPAQDVTVTGTFTVNKYEIVYTLEGEAFKKDSVLYGAAITTPEAPAKEGHTFAGWGEIPATMPANDLALNGTYTVNKYNVIYTVDGTEYKKSEVEYGAAITAEAAPEKEGHTFSGWSEIPETMPAQDVTVTGTFTVNKYEVVYTLEGEAFKKDSVLYGAAITAPEAPAKEGHTFAGWGEVPATMPANDLALNGTYTVNKYNIIYTVDGTEYKKSEVEYGAAITTPEAPAKEGHTFSGWSEIPETMPAQDVTVTGTFTVNKYEIVYKVNGEVYHKDSIAYGETIVAIEIPVKEGYIFSGWSEIPETMPAEDVEVSGNFEADGIEKIFADKQKVDVYTLQGVKIKEQIEVERLEEELPEGIYIVDGQKVVVKK